MSGEAAVPAFAVGVRFRFDATRQAWIVLAPERLLLPDEQAVSILQLVDGVRSLGAIISDLTARFDAPRALIADDVTTMLHALGDKEVLRW